MSDQQDDKKSPGQRISLANTLPIGTVPPALPELTGNDSSLRSSATWSDPEIVLSSSSPRIQLPETAPPNAGIIEAGLESRLPEDRARELINQRFAAAGIALAIDYVFTTRDLAVTLDGFDEAKRIGYAYLSHGDADVVTDFDEATELAFQELAGLGEAFVLVLHDGEVPSEEALETRIEHFIERTRRATSTTQTIDTPGATDTTDPAES